MASDAAGIGGPFDTSDRHEWRDIRRIGTDGMVYPGEVCRQCGGLRIEGMKLPCHPFAGAFGAKFRELIERELLAMKCVLDGCT